MTEEIAKAPAPKGGVFIMGQNRWGYGDDLADAKARFRKEGGKLSGFWLAFKVDDDTEFHGVDGYGRVLYVGTCPSPLPVGTQRKGKVA